MFFISANTDERSIGDCLNDRQPVHRYSNGARLRGAAKLTMALAALGLAIASTLARGERQRAAVAAIEELGGAVVYESPADSYGGPQGWLRTCLGRDAFDDVLAVYLSGTPATDAELACLLNLPRVQTIGLASTRITDAGLPYLRTLHRLTHVDLRFTRVSAGGAAALRRALPETKVLSISDVE
jgi:hypothetical protein